MAARPAVVMFFNDWKVHPHGVNAGGGESATMALARAIARSGYRVIACANLPDGECSKDGIEFWNFGAAYALHTIEPRLREIGPYYCLCATLVHPLLHLREHPHCLARIVINHAPSSHASGLEPATVLELIDYMVCVSYAQRSLMVRGETDADKLVVVPNGFDPDVFEYSGPEDRDWEQLIFIGRLEVPKGIHVLVHVFGELKREFPHLKLSVFGDENYWPEFVSRKREFMERFPGLHFHGKVPQPELARHLRKAGLLVFPSLTFESAGLAVVDAQASGCPVVAYGVGGVPEYLIDGKLGQVVYDKTPEALRDAIALMLRDRQRLQQMSRAALTLGRARPWSVVASEVLSYAESCSRSRSSETQLALPPSVQRMSSWQGVPVEVLLEDHECVALAHTLSDSDLHRALTTIPQLSWPLLIKALRLEKTGSLDQAVEVYRAAASKSAPYDWQPFFRLALLHAERREASDASTCAQEVLKRAPNFPLRSQLETLISVTRVQ